MADQHEKLNACLFKMALLGYLSMINEVDIQTFLAPLPTIHLGILMCAYQKNTFNDKATEAFRRENRFYADCVKTAIEKKDGGWLAGFIRVRGMVRTCKIIADYVDQGKLIEKVAKWFGYVNTDPSI